MAQLDDGHPRMNDARARLRYLDRTIGLLFPGPGEPLPYTLLPHRLVPRRLVPRAWWHPGGKVVVPSGRDTIQTHLSEVLGTPVRVTLHVRPARRANRKPILRAHGPEGTVAFVKIGDTDRTRELVAHEARTLGLLAGVPLKHVTAPVALHHGSWRGLSVLALTPLPVRRGRISHDLLRDAIGEIARIPDLVPGAGRGGAGDVPRVGTIGAGTGGTGTGGTGTGGTGRGGDVPWAGTGGAGRGEDVPWAERRPAGGSRPREHPCSRERFAWHGDLAPWNISRGPDDRLLVWDWERFGTGVPLGFDAVHHFFHRTLRRNGPLTTAEACLAQALPVLGPFGLSAAEARLTALRYLITLADRYAADGHSPLGSPDLWLSPVVDRQEVLL
ncbi:hypothetical protein FHS43_004671 [Streptosporangium becharense]|uniref:Aminoglycoside phosphotransferase domain-containing protein n=1 Tax=Streptosporangium becharense TaxID=1816182 RepID=A0A7W9IHU6_9ACTN|nr:hypothetical protein [Streptosporangium becharense]MBB2913367.1 hypothetical protein [Streptosporangium becharense]MBB5821057.1 hypothetical protein [Streptosporangium becharense]